jgi:hypothetical protein
VIAAAVVVVVFCSRRLAKTVRQQEAAQAGSRAPSRIITQAWNCIPTQAESRIITQAGNRIATQAENRIITQAE